MDQSENAVPPLDLNALNMDGKLDETTVTEAGDGRPEPTPPRPNTVNEYVALTASELKTARVAYTESKWSENGNMSYRLFYLRRIRQFQTTEFIPDFLMLFKLPQTIANTTGGSLTRHSTFFLDQITKKMSDFFHLN